ncbi:MAG: YdeI/OmpD-associated family protein [Dehalococcoidia bacterium]
MTDASARPRRPRHPMPGAVREALAARRLMAAYEARPAYQRNDYLGWIARAQRSETREQRLNQMLGELTAGDVYMNMPWRPRRARAVEG